MISMRELVTQRILFAVTEEELIAEYGVFEEELDTMSDLDLFELYESVVIDTVR